MNYVPFKFTIDGQEFESLVPADSFDKMRSLVTKEKDCDSAEQPKPNGYERAKPGQFYWYDTVDGSIEKDIEKEHAVDDICYRVANYYSSEEVARNNARADKLMRQLRRFAVEHRNEAVDWDSESYKYTIRYSHGQKKIEYGWEVKGQDFGGVWFDSNEAAQLAIETFHDELIWYFTEYKDSL